MRLSMNVFQGQAPKYNDEDLADGMATLCVNSRNDRQTLEGIPAMRDRQQSVAGDTESVYWYNDDRWYAWPFEVTVTRAPLVNDSRKWLAFTDERRNIALDELDPPRLTNNEIMTSSGTTPNAVLMGIPRPPRLRISQPNPNGPRENTWIDGTIKGDFLQVSDAAGVPDGGYDPTKDSGGTYYYNGVDYARKYIDIYTADARILALWVGDPFQGGTAEGGHFCRWGYREKKKSNSCTWPNVDFDFSAPADPHMVVAWYGEAKHKNKCSWNGSKYRRYYGIYITDEYGAWTEICQWGSRTRGNVKQVHKDLYELLVAGKNDSGRTDGLVQSRNYMPKYVAPEYVEVYLRQETFYVATYVDQFGREGPPSLPSQTLNLVHLEKDGSRVDYVDVFPPPMPPERHEPELIGQQPRNFQLGGSWRIYRYNYGQLQFLVEKPLQDFDDGGDDGSGEQDNDEVLHHKDAAPSAFLQEALPSSDWVGPPGADFTVTEDGSDYETGLINDVDYDTAPNGPMRGIVPVAAGFLAGHTDHDICLSVIGTTHAFPYNQRFSVTEEITAVSAHGADIAVLTDGYPYLMQGSNPARMAMARLPTHAPCSNRKAVAEIQGSTYYAGPSTLYRIKGMTVEDVGEGMFTSEGWKALNPDTLEFFGYEGRLYMITDGFLMGNGADTVFGVVQNDYNPGHKFMVMFDPMYEADGIRVVDLGQNVYLSNYIRNENNHILFAENADQLDAYEFRKSDTGELLQVTYESKKYRLEHPIVFTCGRVRLGVANRTCQLTVFCEWGDSADKIWEYSITVQSSSWFWLPTAPLGHRWWVQVHGEPQVRTVELATDPSEFK